MKLRLCGQIRNGALIWPTLFGLLALAACSPTAAVVSAGARVANASQTEKGIRSAATDLRIRAEINHYLFQENFDLLGAVSLAVEQQRVLLTGSVANPEDRIEATRLSWRAKGVREVINELQIKNDVSIADKARDLLIDQRLQSRLLLDKKIRSINFSTDVVNAVVYLFGIARNQTELDRAINHARNIQYVSNVVSYIALANNDN